MHEYPEDPLSALNGGVERAVGVRNQFLHGQQDVSGTEGEQRFVRIHANILTGVNVQRPLLYKDVVLHDCHALVLVPAVLESLVRFPISPFVPASLLKRLPFTAHRWR